MSEITFTVYGEPIAQGRGRAAVVNGKVIVYDPKKSRDYKREIKAEAVKVRPEKPWEGPVSLEIRIYKSIPKSFSGRKRKLAVIGGLRPTTKPDVSNVCKGIEDAIKGIIIRDDSQIVNLSVYKWYSENPRAEIIIRRLEATDENRI